MSVKKKKLNVVTIGGGTGSFTVLSGLKRYPVDISAIVTMADSGGSTGMLRTELGVLPPGDVRQCIVALSQSPELMLKLMNYRFTSGGLVGHNFGNLFISTLEKVSGDLDTAIEHVCSILLVEGSVIPATLSDVTLAVRTGRTWVRGQHIIRENDLVDLKEVRLEPRAIVNPKALKAIRSADVITVGPGGFYTSLVPNFLIDGLSEAITKSKALKIFVVNLMNKHGHTSDLTVRTFTERMEEFTGFPFDIVLYNTEIPSRSLIKRYATSTGQQVVPTEKLLPKRFVGAKLLSHTLPVHLPKQKDDPITRTLIRHDSNKLAQAIMRIVNRHVTK